MKNQAPPTLQINCYGNYPQVLINGTEVERITAIKFTKVAGEDAELELKVDVEGFMQKDK